MYLRERTKPYQEYRVVKERRAVKRYNWPIGPEWVWSEQWRLTKPVRDIIFRICEERGVFIWQVMGTSKRIGLPYTRWMIFRAVKEAHPAWSLPKIGLHTGIFDHTTVLHGLRRIETCDTPHPSPDDLTYGASYYRKIKADPVRFGMMRERKSQEKRKRKEAA